MDLEIEQLVPIPLKENIASGRSEVWQKHLKISQGAHVFLQAPSGTGKTTLIHLLYGLRMDYEGKIFWGEKDFRSFKTDELSAFRAQQLSVVFQDLRLFPELSCWENLEIKRSLTNTVASERVEEMLHRLGIYHKKNSLAKTMSYGEQQRTAIIRALLQPFTWLLLDEPFSHLDNKNIEKAAELMAERAKENNASILLADLEYHEYLFSQKTFQL